MARELNSACSYTFLFNTLHLPCGSLPVTTVREGEQTYQGTFGDLFEKKAACSLGQPCCRAAAVCSRVQSIALPALSLFTWLCLCLSLSLSLWLCLAGPSLHGRLCRAPHRGAGANHEGGSNCMGGCRVQM